MQPRLNKHTASHSTELKSGIQILNSPKALCSASENKTCNPNHTDKFKMTPTTEADRKFKAFLSFGWLETHSKWRAPAKIQRKQVVNATQSATSLPRTPNHTPPPLNAAKKLTNFVTNVNGPGVVSARHKAVNDFACTWPVELNDYVLRHVSKNGIGSTKGYDRKPWEKAHNFS